MGVGLRPLADLVDQAAGQCLPVEDRGRSLDRLDALQRIGIDRGGGISLRIPRHGEAIEPEPGIGIVAADPHPAAAHVVAIGLRHDAGRVAKRLADGVCTARIDLVTRDDADGLRRLAQRRVRLGAAEAAPGDDATVGALRIVAGIVYGDGLKLRRRRILRRQRPRRRAHRERHRRGEPKPPAPCPPHRRFLSQIHVHDPAFCNNLTLLIKLSYS